MKIGYSPEKFYENPASKAYEILKANVIFHSRQNGLRSLAVVSFNPGEGKTATAANLATIFACSGMATLLVDADMRKPMLMKGFKNTVLKGLSNLLEGGAELKEAINGKIIEGVDFIPCGVKPVNPTELINSARFENFIKEVTCRYEIVIFDTPPLSSVIDGALIGAQVDGVLMVIKPGTTRPENLVMAKEQLIRADAKLIGAVLNNVSKREYKEYYSSYDYYGMSGKYKKKWLEEIKNRSRDLSHD